MDNNPQRKEELPKQCSPRMFTTVYGICETCYNTNKVDYCDSGWRYQKCSPFNGVEFAKLPIIRCLRYNAEVDVASSKGQGFHKAMYNGKEMRRHASNDPELLIPPPFLEADATPSQFKNC